MRFDQKVWALLKHIPKGRVTTYKILARRLNSPLGYRAVGNACHRNPNPITVPCHRVICNDGSLGGFAGGLKKKKLLLQKEGILIRNNIICNLEKVLYGFR